MSKKNEPLIIEIISIITIAIGFIVLVCLFFNAGYAGNLIRSILFGLFGYCAILVPLSLTGFSIYMFLADNKIICKSKIWSSLGLIICIVTMLHILHPNNIVSNGVLSYIKENYIAGNLLGAVIGNFIVGLFGNIGSIVLLATSCVVLVIVLTQKSFLKFIIKLTKRNPKTKTKKAKIKKPVPKVSDEPLSVFHNPLSIQDEVIEIEEPPVQNEISTAFNFDEYVFPPIDLLRKNLLQIKVSDEKKQIAAERLESILQSFGVKATVKDIIHGPAITRYELTPEKGVKVSRIASLSDDLALNLAAVGVRIEAPVPGKSVVGIEVPNEQINTVYLREILDDAKFTAFPSNLAFGIGKDVAGNVIVHDITKMPHLLIAGATGSGKSVCINTLIVSIIYKANPKDVKLLMIDPKVVELGIYNGIPHLLIPVVTKPEEAAGALHWAVKEMTRRYNLFAETNVRDVRGYNETAEERLPNIVIIIDELADLMMVAAKDVEESICRLAQMARAAGLHLIIATQRPSTDVITGLIKANIPSRLAFSVSSGIDSRTILDSTGAEKLLGKGDMLFSPIGSSKPIRIQGAFVSDKEVENIVAFAKQNKLEDSTDDNMFETITSASRVTVDESEPVDEFFEASIDLIMRKEKASTSMLQRQFRIGYNRAARIMEELELRGIVGADEGSKPRQILMSKFEWEQRKSNPPF